MSREWYGIVRWNPDDVIVAAASNDIEMSTGQAIEWWEKNEEAFKNRMVELGNEVLSYMDFASER